MKVGRHTTGSGRGFTLVELLLVVALVALLFGAAAFNFATLQNSADLNEGTSRFEALLLFVRSQAQYTGRRLILRFDTASTNASPGFQEPIRVEWEPDPIEHPGRYEMLPEASFYIKNLLELVQLTRVTVGDDVEDPNSVRSENRDATPSVDQDGRALETPPALFFPDGTSDSLAVELASNRPEDPRHVRVRLEGITGAISREFVSADPLDRPSKTDFPEEDEPEEMDWEEEK